MHHNRAAVCLHVAHIAALEAFWTDWYARKLRSYHKTWNPGHDYTKWNTTLYPSDGPQFVQKLGNLSMTYYTNGFGADNAHAKANGGPWDFVKKGNEPHPNVSYAFYKSIFGNAASKWNMKMLFTDCAIFAPASEYCDAIPALATPLSRIPR